MAFLCLLCHQAGHKTADCPDGKQPRGTNKPGPKAILSFPPKSTQKQSDTLCDRCDGLRLLDLLLREDVQDELTSDVELAIDNYQLYRSLGPYRSIEFVDSCPLCRLLFSIFPPEDTNIEPSDEYLLKPLRTYNRLGGSLKGEKKAHLYEQYTVSISIIAKPMVSRQAVELLATADYRFKYDTSIGIVGHPSLPSSGPSPPSTTRSGLPIRVRDPVVDFKTIQSWLRRCDAEHPDCKNVWVDELLTTSMIDVQTMTIVPCPPNCEYLALSYVWGPIVPEPDALKKGTLPATITDAMEATKQLGFRYLWIDALCIDQDPSSPVKIQQLSIMDRIYAGAYATLVAFYGDSSLFGLRGTTQARARTAQPRETIVDTKGGGSAYELSAMYPTMTAEWEYPTCTHRTRAWTLQEEYLSQRLIIFGQDQVHYRCQNVILQETVDETNDPAHVLDLLASGEEESGEYLRELSRSRALGSGSSTGKKTGAGPTPARRRQMAATQFASCISDYTARKMVYDRDSLNACLGMLSFLRRMADLSEFVWGLPLQDFPVSLMWCHSASSGTGNVKPKPPRRRSAFPSWSFVGWEGEVSYLLPDNLLPTAEKTERVREDMARKEMALDLCIEFVDIQDQTLTVAGWTVRFDIQTAPFSTAFVPGKPDEPIGMLTQNDERHPTSLPPGVVDFVVVQRLTRDMGNGRFRHVLYLVMLDDNGPGAVPSRRTLVQWNVESSFIPTPAYEAMLKRNDNIQMV
ncbi:hypothetical protein HMPREF1624_05442 [Sporothrix schenckii ATCC 58251]|uniref:Heterokaryon incompatibility domain-containing protein n=1 Tax=Sporothrix schenckii (strain ATCC 58251 / de Perez 2211183) TaxID=1391915 RepID=U7PW07_SPOS1|nr:hypothetical protein HMPREF1624_05442 [Sporothrix schenckii ATCC 58251]